MYYDEDYFNEQEDQIDASNLSARQKLKMMITVDEFNKNNKTCCRRRCFSCRQAMIMHSGMHTALVLLSGFLTLLAPLLSFVIIHAKFKSSLTRK